MMDTAGMGAWGIGVFENDGAGDFLAQFRHTAAADRGALVRETLTEAADEEDYVDRDAAQAAVAAAAVVAAAHTGSALDDPTGAVPAADLPSTEPALVSLALRALDRVAAEDSEWRELWEEVDSFDDAVATLDELRAALT
jgi:hypothetical protein